MKYTEFDEHNKEQQKGVTVYVYVYLTMWLFTDSMYRLFSKLFTS